MTEPATFERIAQLEVQVDWLRQLVDQLYRELKVAPPPYRPPVTATPSVDPAIAEALASGNKIAAIKLYRERTGVGLAEAKAAIDALDRH